MASEKILHSECLTKDYRVESLIQVQYLAVKKYATGHFNPMEHDVLLLLILVYLANSALQSPLAIGWAPSVC